MHVEKILIRGPNWVGDSVLSIPAMEAVRGHFPTADITLLVRPWVAGLFASASYLDRVWSEPRPSSLADWAGLARKIRDRHFDLAVLFPNSFESALMMFLGRVPVRLGYATDGRRLLLTDAVSTPSGESRHQVHYYLDLVENLANHPGASGHASSSGSETADFSAPSGISLSASGHASSSGGETPVRFPSSARRGGAKRRGGWLEPAEKAQEDARGLLAGEGIGRGEPFMVLNPGAAYGSAKRWSEERFAETGDRLAKSLGLRIAIVGSKSETPAAEEIRARAQTPVSILTGKTTLEMLIGVLAESSLVITNDSGPMHIAAALGIPTVAIFGPTDERVTAPLAPQARVVKHPVECSPCLLRECPIDHRCMTRVSVDDVYRAAEELLAHA